MSVAEHVKAIIRRSKSKDKLNILVIGSTHERYEQALCLTGHNFYCLPDNTKRWDTDYGKRPKNYLIIDEIPYHLELDLILVHTSCDRLKTAFELRNYFKIPVIRHTHVLPDVRFDVKEQIKSFQQIRVDLNTFISKFSMNAWGYSESNAMYVNHGMDTDFWCVEQTAPRDNHLLSVVNLWKHRDWACGWNLWNAVIGADSLTKLPFKVVGKNEGLSKPARSIEELRKEYMSSKIFLNTSLHSPVPMSLLEAMACGCAVVSTNTCMIPEIIQHGYNGLLGTDAKELREHCIKLLSDNDLSQELGRNAKKTIKEIYNINNFINKWNNIFESVIQ